jgi:hypothetical protein
LEELHPSSVNETRASIARMRSPAGWTEPGQRPEFDEYTVVLDGSVHVETDSGSALEAEATARTGPHPTHGRLRARGA